MLRGLLLGVTGFILTACDAQTGPRAEPGCHLHVAWDPYEPYSYSPSDAAAGPVGYDIDVISKVAGMMNCRLDFSEMAWSDILVALESGDVDITIGTGYKPDRAAWSWYSESYRNEVVGLMVRNGAAGDWSGSTLRELFEQGLIFGKTTDDTYDAQLESVFAAFSQQVRPRVSEAENVRRLLDESIDAFLVEIYVGAATAARLNAADAVEYHPLKFDAGAYRLQMSKRTVSAERLAAIDAAIQELAASGWLQEQLSGYGMRNVNKEQ